jgi:hypothetical protein
MTTYSVPGVFNVLDYFMVAGPTGGAAANATALQSAIDAAQASGNPNGAIILIPSYSLDESGDRQYGPYQIASPAPRPQPSRFPTPEAQRRS